MGKKRRNRQPSDPAEIARQRAERDRYTRNAPAEWGVNRSALRLPQNEGVEVIEPTRERVSRVTRYDCFVTLGVEGAAYLAVRRYQEDLAARYRCEGSAKIGEIVDGTGSADLGVSARSIDAGKRLDAVKGMMLPWQANLISGLSLPIIVHGQQVNWQVITKRCTGLTERHAMGRAVRTAAEAVRAAYAEIDNGMRKAA